MDFKAIQEANSVICTTPIQGKDYAEVNQRVKAFRFLCPEGAIETDMISNENGVCIFRAVVRDAEGKILGTGTAYEKEGAGFINKTSYIENCETSAVGRALGMCGIGIDTSMASYEEVANAKLQQSQTEAKPTEDTKAMKETEAKGKVLSYINRHNYSAEQIEQICKLYNVSGLNKLTYQHCQHYIKFIEKQGGNIDE